MLSCIYSCEQVALQNEANPKRKIRLGICIAACVASATHCTSLGKALGNSLAEWVGQKSPNFLLGRVSLFGGYPFVGCLHMTPAGKPTSIWGEAQKTKTGETKQTQTRTEDYSTLSLLSLRTPSALKSASVRFSEAKANFRAPANCWAVRA